MIVANPIYDIVFKYLMEDERIARTILSALLKQDVVSVEVRPHEYTGDQRSSLSVFRIDFGATIREADGTQKPLKRCVNCHHRNNYGRMPLHEATAMKI